MSNHELESANEYLARQEEHINFLKLCDWQNDEAYEGLEKELDRLESPALDDAVYKAINIRDKLTEVLQTGYWLNAMSEAGISYDVQLSIWNNKAASDEKRRNFPDDTEFSYRH